jgi:Domain of Unknown Function with PDB structure (DUF3857)/Transglutaminase-like superfamily
MRRSILLTSLVLVSIASPGPLAAQFKEPTREELRMTDDEKAPGAAAVYLNREDVASQQARIRSLYERIKVLAESGKELATVQIPYEPGRDKVDVQGRTIHADGTVIPMTEAPNDLIDLKTKGYQHNTLVFTLPSVEVGSILEYRITKRATGVSFLDPVIWMVQQPYFVHEAHYSYRPFIGSRDSFVARLPPGEKVVRDTTGEYALNLEDIAPLPNDDWMPPLNTLKWRVSFFYANFGTTDVFWERAGKGWAEFVREFTKPTGTLKSAAEGMIAPSDTETVKAQKIYAAVIKLENTDFTRQKSAAERKKQKIKEIRNAQDVWKEQGGNADEIALLYVALCRAVGLNVNSMKVVDRSKSIFDGSMPSTSQLDDYIAVGQLDGKEVYLDPGEKVCPFGMLRWTHMLTSGFRYDGNSASIKRTPSFGISGPSIERIANLTIDETGNLQGTVRIVFAGQEALRWRRAATANDTEELKKLFDEWLDADIPEGVHADFDHFLALDDYEANLIGTARITGTLGTVTGRRMFLPGLFFESKARHPFVAQEKRTVGVDLEFPKTESDDVTYKLPSGFSVESTPRANGFEWPDHANFSISLNTKEGEVNVVRAFGRSFTLVDAKDYGSLREFYQKVAAADQQQVVLIRPATKSN